MCPSNIVSTLKQVAVHALADPTPACLALERHWTASSHGSLVGSGGWSPCAHSARKPRSVMPSDGKQFTKEEASEEVRFPPGIPRPHAIDEFKRSLESKLATDDLTDIAMVKSTTTRPRRLEQSAR